jgi:hypothetical protein
MKTIWKFKLEPNGVVEMPAGSEVLCIQTQNNEPHLWAEVDTEAKSVIRRFHVIGTGYPFPWTFEKPSYVGTFQLKITGLVFHVYTDRKEYPR